MNDQSQKSPLQIWKDLHNVTSLPASADGVTPCSSQEFQQQQGCGPDLHPASHSALLESSLVSSTSDTLRQPLCASLTSAALQSFLGSRLRQQLENTGSMIYSLSWKDKVTPAGRPYCQRQASAPRTNAIDFSLVPWATPHTSASTGAGTQGRAGGMNIQTMAALAAWPTVTTIDNNQVAGEGAAANHPARGTTLGGMARVAAWPTPTTRDHKDGAECLNVPINSLLGRQVWQAAWPSPTANSNDRTPKPENAMRMQRNDGTKIQQRLQDFAAITQPIRITASGQTLTGSDAGMESSGQLRPAHSRWLMGFPVEWDAAAIRACEKPLKKSASRLAPTSPPVSPGSEGTETRSYHNAPQNLSKPSLAANKIRIRAGSFEHDGWLMGGVK